MAIGSTALAHFLIVLVIGIVAGLAFRRYASSWLIRLGVTTRSDITSALVGIAGAFIGFHLGVILGLLPSPLMLYLAAVAGAVIYARLLPSASIRQEWLGYPSCMQVATDGGSPCSSQTRKERMNWRRRATGSLSISTPMPSLRRNARS